MTESGSRLPQSKALRALPNRVRPSFQSAARLLSSAFFFLLTTIAHAAAPGTHTEPAQFVDAYRVHLVGTVTPNGQAATAWFEYGLSKAYGGRTALVNCATAGTVDLPVTGLKEQTPYHFRVVARAGTATVYGADGTFTTLAAFPADIVSQPPDAYQLTKVGQSGVTVSIVGTGSSAVYQWLHNGAAVPLAKYETYYLPKITAASAGSYTCRVSNPRRTLISNPAVVAVATISPAAGFIANEGASFSLSAAVSPANPAATYAWRGTVHSTLDGIGTVTGASTSRLTVAQVTGAASDSYVCDIVSNGQTVTVGPVAVAVRLKPVIPQVLPLMFQTGQKVAMQVRVDNSPTAVAVTGLPRGLVYSATLHSIVGRPVVSSPDFYTVTVTARNLAGAAKPMVFFLNVDPLDPAVKTTFNGLVDRQPSLAGGSNYGGALSNLVIGATGAFTGRLTLGAASFALAGQLDAVEGADPTATLSVRRAPPLKNLTLAFSIDRLTGRLAGSVTEEGGAWTANVTAWGNPWSAIQPATGFAGPHNLWFVPPSGLPAGSAPEGVGNGSATISNSGGAALSFKLADGTVVTGAATMNKDGEVPVHAMLYASHGSVHGTFQITDQAGPALNTVAGSLTWNKTAAASKADRSYVPAGFDFGVADSGKSLAVQGGEQKAQAGVILWGLADVPNTQVNAKLGFSGGGIGSAALALSANISFNLSKTYGVTIHGTNLTAETLTVNGTTGAFNGSFTLYDGMPAVQRPVKFYGMVVPGQAKGRGFFTLPQLPAGLQPLASTPVLSGMVDFSQAP